MARTNWDNRGAQHLDALGRLRPGSSLEQARAELDALAAQLAQEHADDKGLRVPSPGIAG
jgi:hypothetical protein